MRRYPVVLACLLLVLSLAPDFCRGFFPSLSCDPVEFKSSLQVGYQRLGFNFNVPTGPPSFSGGAVLIPIGVNCLDLKFEDANTWVGALELGADVGPNLYVFLRGEANAPRGVDVITGENDVGLYSIRNPYQWRGSGLEWWVVELGCSYAFPGDISFLAGFRVDHLSLKLRDPVDRTGNPVNFAIQQAGPGFNESALSVSQSENAFGDLQTKLWIPYLGVSIDGVNYRMKVIWSPFAWAKVSVPLRLLTALELREGDFFSYSQNDAFDLRYRVYNPACLLEGTFEYDVDVNNTFGLQLWCRYSWLNTCGKGSMNGRHSRDASVQGEDLFFLPLGDTSEGDSASAVGKFSRYTLTLGITGLLSF